MDFRGDFRGFRPDIAGVLNLTYVKEREGAAGCENVFFKGVYNIEHFLTLLADN